MHEEVIKYTITHVAKTEVSFYGLCCNYHHMITLSSNFSNCVMFITRLFQNFKLFLNVSNKEI